ncbi:hypothetical protein [Hyphomicrobium sp. CS1GBMeth3]|uniref:hypothetical protein n=1 Tax=Hyphomicrobium sp. CS1GBMeth3 TaxID=1892845 RepID=UPI000932044B|nr:hypothetical protein [Hyphomicrobium sp. CS1GBMeth3]
MLVFDGPIHISQLPPECIEACWFKGYESGAAQAWVRRLDVHVNRRKAIDALSGSPFWSGDNPSELDADELAAAILELACGRFAEYLHWRKRNPYAETAQCPHGSPYFEM